MWQQGWSSEPCDMNKYGTCASYLACSLHPCSCLCMSSLNMRHKSYYFSWLLSYFSWYVCSLWINILNYEHRKCLTILWSPSASIVTTTRVDATILCWMKTHTSPSRLGLASKIVRYATSTTCSSYLSMHDLSFCFNVSFFYNSTSASLALQDVTFVTRSMFKISMKLLEKKLTLRRNILFLRLTSLMNQRPHSLAVQNGMHYARHMHLMIIWK